MEVIQKIPKLTKTNELTIARLKQSDYGSISQGNLTSTLKKILDNKTMSEELIPKVVEYEKIKNPTKDIKWIEKYILKKLDMKDKKMWTEVLNKGDFTSFEKKKSEPSMPSTTTEQLPQGDFSSFPSIEKKTKTKTSGSDNQLQDILEKILNEKNEKKESVIKIPKVKKTDTDYSKIFEGSGEFYTKNKSTIDKLKKSLTKEKIADGSWFTGLSSLAVPEIEIISELLKGSPIGMTDIDKSNLKKILDGENVGNVGLKTILKSLVNPDAVGSIISTQGEKVVNKAGDSLSDFWSKLTTGKGLVAPKEQGVIDTEKLIQTRRDELDAKEKRKKDLQELGINTDYEQPINSGYSVLTPEQIAKNPQLALEETSAGEDFLTGLQNLIFGTRNTTLNTKEKMRAYLQANDPKKLAIFDEEVRRHNIRIKKVNLDSSSAIDTEVHGDILKSVTDFNRSLIKTASSLKQLTNQQIEEIYDINATLEQVMAGKRTLSYDDLQNAMSSIYSVTPPSVFKQLGNGPKALVADIRAKLGMGFKGDSDLSNVDRLLEDKIKESEKPVGPDQPPKDVKPPIDNEPPSDGEPPKPPDGQNPINEVDLDDNKNNIEQSWSEYRPRMAWGNSNEQFYRTDQNVNMGNLISEAKCIEKAGWGNGADSSLYKKNLMQDEMRYGRTFPMPVYQQEFQPKFTPNFYKVAQPQWNPVLVRPPINRSIDEMKGAATFDQFLHFTPAYPQSAFEVTNREEQYQYYPDVRNIDYGNQELQSYKSNLWNQLRRQRF